MSEEWQPNEEYLNTLVSMGINEKIAAQALFCADNKSIDEALNYVFGNHDTSELLQASNPLEGSESDGANDPTDTLYYKMVFVVNTALKMGTGKIAAQVGHACLGLFREIMVTHGEQLTYWENIGEKKIVVKGNDDMHLLELQEKAKTMGIPCYLIRDAGHTQIAPGSITVLGLFGLEDALNEVTGKLSLL